jgi:hypothetical protein
MKHIANCWTWDAELKWRSTNRLCRTSLKGLHDMLHRSVRRAFFAWTSLPQNTPCSQKLVIPGLYGLLVWRILLKNTSVISLNCNRRFRFGKPNYTLSSLLWRRHFAYFRLQRRHWLPTRPMGKKKINFWVALQSAASRVFLSVVGFTSTGLLMGEVSCGHPVDG